MDSANLRTPLYDSYVAGREVKQVNFGKCISNQPPIVVSKR